MQRTPPVSVFAKFNEVQHNYGRMRDPVNRKKLKIYQEEVKSRHTSHWDWDYLPTQELEAAVKEGDSLQHEKRNDRSKFTRLLASLWKWLRS